VVLFAVEDGKRTYEGDFLYDSSIFIDIVVSFLISLGFLFYGMRLSLTKLLSEDKDPTKFKEAVKTIFTTVVFTLCFLLRVAMFSYRFVTGSYIKDYDLFTVLAYYVAEIIPSMLQIYIVESSRGRSNRESQYIIDLYEGQVDKTFEEAIRTQYDSIDTDRPVVQISTNASGVKRETSTPKSLTQKTPLLVT